MAFFGSDKRRKTDLALMLLAVILANLNAVFSKSLLGGGWNPLQLYIAILIVLTLFMLVYQIVALEIGGRWGMTREDIFGTVIAAVSGGVAAPLLFFEGLAIVTASNAIIITTLMPFFVVCFAVLMMKEHFTPQMAFGGFLLMGALASLLIDDLRSFTLQTGAILVLLSSVFSAFSAIVHKKYVKHQHIDSVVLVRTVISLLLTLLWMLISEPQSLGFLAAPQNVWLFLSVPVGCFLIPSFLYFRALPKLTAMDTGMLEALGRVIGIMAAGAILGEALTVRHLISIALAIFGILFLSVPLTRWRIVPSRLPVVGPLRK